MKGPDTKDGVDVVEKVLSVEDKDGTKVVIVGQLHTDGKFYPHRERVVSDKGVVQTKDLYTGDFSSPCVLLKLPHKADQTWDAAAFKETLVARGPEEVKVPSGTYQAIRVEYIKQGDDKRKVIRTEWYAPRVGIVKLRTGDIEIVLKSFTAGKE
jgi:hypothetical protein